VSDQLSLPGLDAEPASLTPEPRSSTRGELMGYSLFFAVFPQSEDAARLAEASLDIIRPHGLGKPMAAHRLHVTLLELGSFEHMVPQALVDAAVAGAAAMSSAPFDLVFDRAMSFGKDDRAFVLRCDPDSDAAVGRLRRTLHVQLKQRALQPKPSSTPHMTIAYGLPGIAEHAIEPLRWTATAFTLILSHVGLKHHQQLGRWPLVVDAGSN